MSTERDELPDGVIDADPSGGGESAPTQDEPRLELHDTSDQERLDGLIAQLRADVGGQNAATVDKAVRGRLAETGVPAEEEVILALIAELAADESAD